MKSGYKRGPGSAVDASGIEGLGGKVDGAVGDGGTGDDSGKVLDAVAAEPDHVAALGDGDIDAEEGGVRHPVEREQGAVEVGDSDYEAGAGAYGKANGGAGHVASGDSVRDDARDLGLGEAAVGASGFRDQIALGGLAGAAIGTKRIVPSRSARGVAGGQSGLFDEGQGDAVDDDGSGGWHDGGEAVEDRAGDGCVFHHGVVVRRGGVGDDTDAAGDTVILEDRNAAGVDCVGIGVEKVGFAGEDAEAG